MNLLDTMLFDPSVHSLLLDGRSNVHCGLNATFAVPHARMFINIQNLLWVTSRRIRLK